jgi:nitrate/nitrite transporter NarK
MRAVYDSGRDRSRRLFAPGLLAGPLRLVLSDPALRRLALASCAYSGMQVTFTAFLVTYLHDGLGMPLVLAGAVLSAAQACGVGGRVLWGIVADRFVPPHRVLGGLGLGMTASALVTAAFTPAWPLAAIVAVCMVYGGTAVAWNGVFLAQVARLSPPGKAGEVTGGSTFLTFGGVVVLPAAFSAVTSASGSYVFGFAAAAALTLVSSIACFRAGGDASSARPQP